MAITSIQEQSAPTTTTTSAVPNPTAADKETFLKLLVAQLAHQDPLEPMKGTEFVTQLAQFSAVEQAVAQSQQLDLLSAQMTGLANNAVVDLVGKEVTVRGNGIAFDGENPVSSNVTLEGAADKVTATVTDENGAVIKTIEIGPKPTGALKVTWDGTTDDGAQAPAGKYTIEVNAEKADGKAVSVTQDVTGVVVGVTFEKGYAELILDSGATAPVGDLVSVNTPNGGTTEPAAKPRINP